MCFLLQSRPFGHGCLLTNHEHSPSPTLIPFTGFVERCCDQIENPRSHLSRYTVGGRKTCSSNHPKGGKQDGRTPLWDAGNARTAGGYTTYWLRGRSVPRFPPLLWLLFSCLFPLLRWWPSALLAQTITTPSPNQGLLVKRSRQWEKKRQMSASKDFCNKITRTITETLHASLAIVVLAELKRAVVHYPISEKPTR